MPSLTSLLSRAIDELDGSWFLAGVPLVVALLSVDNFRQPPNVDFHVGVSFGFPVPVSTAWSFLSLPSSGVGVTVPFGSFALAAPYLLASALVTAALGAGYLGGIDRALRGERVAFLTNVRRYFLPILGFQLFVAVGSLLAFGVGVLLPPLLLLVIPLLLLAAYLLYPAPYLVVVEELGIVAALGRAYDLTVGGGAPLSYFFQYLLAAVAVSIPATLVFVNLGVAGLLLGCFALAPVALVFDTATMAFVRELVGADQADGPTPAIRRIDG